MHERDIEQQPNNEFINAGRILYLTKDLELIQKQLIGEQLTNIKPDELLDNISTDIIIPNKPALLYMGQDGYLSHFALTGISQINPGDIEKGHFQTLVAGKSFARGSSRIHAPLALKEAGINLIIADAERIFFENCINTGLYVLKLETKQAQKLLNGGSLSIDEILNSLTDQSKAIIKSGGLLAYFKDVENKNITPKEYTTTPRPMTIAEKILSNKVYNPNNETYYVKPGQEIIAIPDQYYGYELQSPPMVKALRDEFGTDLITRFPEKTHLYSDHTALLWDETSIALRKAQTNFANNQKITVYQADRIQGASAICHTDMMESHALPGQLILGNDSHTDTLGVLNCFAIGKGAIDLAGAIAYDKMIITVPETIRINLNGKLSRGVTTKDFMLSFGSNKELKTDRIGSGRVFEFGGQALDEIPFDEQLKLTNMSIEILGFTGIIEPNNQMINFLMTKRGLSKEKINSLIVTSDKNAKYSHIFNIDLSKIEPYIALPGDTQNGKPLSEIIIQHVKIQKAYIGSCTHGTVEDLRQAAEVLRGRKIAEGVKLYVQANSTDNLKEARNKGYINDLIDAGATILPIGCGACINAGEGSTEIGETAIFATNRNFPGRTGKGDTYLASSVITAASAITGFICGPEELKSYFHF